MRAVAQALAPGLLELSLRDLIDEYAVALEVAGRSRRTIEWYRTYLEEFAAFAGRGNQTGTLEDLTPAIARRWLLALQSSRPRPLAPNSMAGRVRTLRASTRCTAGGVSGRDIAAPLFDMSGDNSVPF